jgi:hypothetical protein
MQKCNSPVGQPMVACASAIAKRRRFRNLHRTIFTLAKVHSHGDIHHCDGLEILESFTCRSGVARKPIANSNVLRFDVGHISTASTFYLATGGEKILMHDTLAMRAQPRRPHRCVVLHRLDVDYLSSCSYVVCSVYA